MSFDIERFIFDLKIAKKSLMIKGDGRIF